MNKIFTLGIFCIVAIRGDVCKRHFVDDRYYNNIIIIVPVIPTNKLTAAAKNLYIYKSFNIILSYKAFSFVIILIYIIFSSSNIQRTNPRWPFYSK